MDKKVSVVTPAYNRAHFLAELIQFMQRQTYENWELIIVDDGSEDDTEEIINEARQQDNRISFFQRKDPPKGGARCRNIGMERATGDYLIFLDSDDLLASFALEQRVQYLEENPDLDFAVFYGLKFNETPGDSNQLVNKEINPGHALDAFLSGNYPWHTAAPIWRKNSLRENKIVWDERLSIFQDIDFHIRVLLKELKFEINTHARPDYFWRIHEDDKIGNYKSLPAKFDSCEYIIPKLGDLLKTHDKLNDETKKYLTRFAFYIARILTMENEIQKGLRLWRSGYDQKYIHLKDYYRGKILLYMFNVIYTVFGGGNSMTKTKFRKLYYKIMPGSFELDKDVFIYKEDIKI